MKIKRRTPRTDMEKSGIMLVMGDIYEGLAGKYKVTQGALSIAMAHFAYLSARVAFEADEVDFELALPLDSEEQLEEKFASYMDTKMPDIVNDASDQLEKMDKGTDVALAPGPPTEKK